MIRSTRDDFVKTSTKSDLYTDEHTPYNRTYFPMGEINYFSLTGTSVTISAQSDGSTNMVKAGPSTALSSNAYEFDNGGADNGRLRYIGEKTKHFHVACTISFMPTDTNDVFVVGIAKNGTVISESKILNQISGISQIQSTALHIMAQLAQNDYLELYVGNTTDTDDFTVNTLTMFAMGM